MWHEAQSRCCLVHGAATAGKRQRMQLCAHRPEANSCNVAQFQRREGGQIIQITHAGDTILSQILDSPAIVQVCIQTLIQRKHKNNWQGAGWRKWQHEPTGMPQKTHRRQRLYTTVQRMPAYCGALVFLKCNNQHRFENPSPACAA